jgi:hypothetical protein
LKRSAGVLIADKLYARSECHNQINNKKESRDNASFLSMDLEFNLQNL